MPGAVWIKCLAQTGLCLLHVQPWTLEHFCPFSALRELDVSLWRSPEKKASKLELAAGLTGAGTLQG